MVTRKEKERVLDQAKQHIFFWITIPSSTEYRSQSYPTKRLKDLSNRSVSQELKFQKPSTS